MILELEIKAYTTRTWSYNPQLRPVYWYYINILYHTEMSKSLSTPWLSKLIHTAQFRSWNVFFNVPYI